MRRAVPAADRHPDPPRRLRAARRGARGLRDPRLPHRPGSAEQCRPGTPARQMPGCASPAATATSMLAVEDRGTRDLEAGVRRRSGARHGDGQHARAGRADRRRAAGAPTARTAAPWCTCACPACLANASPPGGGMTTADSSGAGRRSCARAPGLPPHPRGRDGHRGRRRGRRRRRSDRARSAARARRRRARHEHAGDQRAARGDRDPARAARPARS